MTYPIFLSDQALIDCRLSEYQALKDNIFEFQEKELKKKSDHIIKTRVMKEVTT
jgi:hypothetical protein